MVLQRRLTLYLVVAGLLISMVPVTSVSGQSARDERRAAEQAIYLSELEAKGRASALYRLMHSDSKKVSPREAVVGWYETDFFSSDPQPITEILSVRFITWTWEVTGERYRDTAEIDFVQPFGRGSDVTYIEETVRLVEEDGEWRWFFGRSQEFVEEQIDRFVEDDSDSRGSSDDDEAEWDSEDEGLPGSTRSCKLVEVYPGYPGYRGNITGVMPHWGGLGDIACVEHLEQQDPRFSQSREDRRNKAAARSVGIQGSPSDWTWENWMLIEIERGMAPQCYSCLMFNASTIPINTEIYPDPNDPRIRSGLAGTRVAIDRMVTDINGQPPPDQFYYAEDYVLRAEGYLLAGWTANAPQLVESMESSLENIFEPGGGYYTVNQILTVLMDQGGYMSTEYGSEISDQITIATYTFYISQGSSIPQSWGMLLDQFNDQLSGWQQSGYKGSLAAWLRDNWDI